LDEAGTKSRMTMNDLTAPLGQGPRPYRRAIEVSAAQIIAVALGLFFGAFVLWAVIAEDRVGGEPGRWRRRICASPKRRRRS
jgi:hypothetical protein